MTVLGIIPARGGSKRLPNKNLLELDGRPLVAHTCEVALASGVLTAVYVNTDSPAIAQAAERAGVKCPVLRPAELAADDTPTHASNEFLLDFLAWRGERYDALMVLQPTSPLRAAADIREAWELFEANAPCAVVSASPVRPASWLGHVGRDGRFEPLEGNDTLYALNGAIYVYTWDDYRLERQPARTLVHPMPRDRGVDVDTPEDFEVARLLLERRRREPCYA